MSSEPRTIALINPNTNAATTDMMVDLARETLPEWRVEGYTAPFGPRMITETVALEESVVPVVQLGHQVAEHADAIIVSAFGDPGRTELAEALTIPVIGIGQAAILRAAADGPFGIATTTRLLADSLRRLVEAHDGEERFTGIELTEADPLDLAADPDEQFRQLLAAVRRGSENGAESMIIGGGPLSATARRLRDEVDVGIVEPIPAACELVSSMLHPAE
ncbi:Asp/Glu/hydantoin racemase [Brevibacterium sanguinis]|uniref:Asp/Glu/hydantoin racemase n=2 Tax=Brevibacterium TaxID=1696 RepID=A0A366IK10_9MICO|nr:MULTISPECIES: aspartate/glutamate racemase family protein [Brevibacterium]RBP66112.1 Asp/Glu/hydantoin racemase [Brevibacterium sanguinis]RBP72763.1 Asp/Glu/hydantoin racemase [Brevibacterium celere]